MRIAVTRDTGSSETDRAARLAYSGAGTKAQFADDVSGSPDSISVGELAKLLKQNGVDTERLACLHG